MVEDSGFEPDSWDSKSQVQTNIPILNKFQSGGVRTHDFSVPSGARYQTALLTVIHVIGVKPALFLDGGSFTGCCLHYSMSSAD